MKEKSIKVLFIASEFAPLVKVGGLGDVSSSLPKALKELGIDIRVVIPKYKIASINRCRQILGSVPKKIASGIKVSFDNREERFDLYSSQLPKSELPLYLIDQKKYLGSKEVYPSNFSEQIFRFLFFSKAVLEIFRVLNWQPEILHLNDWQTAILSVLAKKQKSKFKTLLTIHNLAHQGVYKSKRIFQMLGLKEEMLASLKKRDKFGNFNILQQGILQADLITTVSPTYSKEILTKKFEENLENDLKKRRRDLFGILNGLDLDQFNPLKDPNIAVAFQGESMTNLQLEEIKKRNKIYLQRKLRLPIISEIPLIGLISRLDEQKGFDLFRKAFEKIIKMNLQIVLLGKGCPETEKVLKEFSLKYPDKFSCQIRLDLKLAQQIYAGSDIFLMPSRFEPCGLSQMIAMRYGAVPIVRKTGGLADTVVDYQEQIINRKSQIANRKSRKGIGFVFEKYSSEEMIKKIKQALKIYKDKKLWNGIIKFNLERDFSWKQSAKEYLKLYKKL